MSNFEQNSEIQWHEQETEQPEDGICFMTIETEQPEDGIYIMNAVSSIIIFSSQ